MPEAPSNRNVMIVLAYLWPLAFVPLLFDKVAILKGINGGRLSVPGVSAYASRF